MTRQWKIGAVLLAVSALTGFGQTAEQVEQVVQANRALAQGDADTALSTYRRLAEQSPDDPILQYNQAVALYRQGKLDQASALFGAVAADRDADLAAKARYNLGNCAYAKALSVAAKQPDKAMQLLDKAISRYRDALQLNPSDTDARANVELARLLQRQLKQQQQKQQQQQQQDKQQQDQSRQKQKQDPQQSDDSAKSQDQQQANKQKQNKSNDPSKQKDQNDQSAQQKDQQQKDHKQKDPSKQQDPSSADKQQQPSAGDQQSEQSEPDTPRTGAAGGVTGKPTAERPKSLTREEAAKLMQKVRDKQFRRRMEQVRREMRQRRPAYRDW